MALFAEQLRSDEVNEAFAPAGPLHNQKPAASLYDVADGFFLTIAKCGIFQTRTQAKQLKCM